MGQTIAAADAAAGEPRAQLHRCGTTYYSHDERQAEVRPEVADQRGDLDAVGALGLVAEVGLVVFFKRWTFISIMKT